MIAAVVPSHSVSAGPTANSSANQFSQVRQLALLGQQVTGLAQSLEDERDLTAGFIAAGRPADLLDIGTGTGRMLEVLGPHVGQALGIDQSREMLAVARVNIERAGLANGTVRLGDMYQLPLPDARFDAAVIHQVLHYAERPGDAIAEAARVLRPNGVLIVADFAPHTLEFLREEQAHRRLGFTDGEVAEWCRTTESGQGGPMIDVPWVQMDLARAHARLEAMKLLNWRMAAALDAGALAPADSSAVKVYGTETLVDVYRTLLGVLGAAGYLPSGSPGAVLHGDVERAGRAAQINTFGGGVNEVQREIIASAGLGMARRAR